MCIYFLVAIFPSFLVASYSWQYRSYRSLRSPFDILSFDFGQKFVYNSRSDSFNLLWHLILHSSILTRANSYLRIQWAWKSMSWTKWFHIIYARGFIGWKKFNGEAPYFEALLLYQKWVVFIENFKLWFSKDHMNFPKAA